MSKVSRIKKVAEFFRRASRGVAYVDSRFDVKVPAKGKCVVNVLDKTTKNTLGNPISMFRVDNAHATHTKYPHININPKWSGVPDPHTRISASQLAVAKSAGEVLQLFNRVAHVAIALDIVRVGFSVVKDVKNGTSRNMIETGAEVAGGWFGAFGAGATGAAIGTKIFPGIGTFFGALAGGMAGGNWGSVHASAAIQAVCDRLKHNMEARKCKKCGKEFEARLYKGENDQYCCVNCR